MNPWKTKTTRVLTTAAIAFVLVWSGFLFISWQIKQTGDQLVSNTQLIKQDQQFVDEYTKLTTLLTNTNAERDQLAQLVLSNNDQAVVDFLSNVDDLARRMVVTLDTKSVDIQSPKGAEFDSLVVEMTISGTNDRVHDMLNLLEVLPYHSHVASVSLVREPETDSVHAEVALTVLVRKK